MKHLFIIFLLMPFTIIAQSYNAYQYFYPGSQNAEFPPHFRYYPPENNLSCSEHLTSSFLFNRKPKLATASLFNSSLVGEKLQSTAPQETPNPINHSLLPGIKKAGDNLRTSMWTQYAANTMGLLVPLLGYTKKTEIKYSGWRTEVEEKRQLSSLGYMLSIGAITSSFYSFYTAGKSGSELYKTGNQISSEAGYNLSKSGKHLRNFRTLSFVSSGMNFMGQLFVLNSLSSLQNDNEEESLAQFWTGVGFSVTSFILKIISVNHVGKAGSETSKFSQKLPDNWQNRYFSNAGTHLTKYNKHWDQGIGYLLGGLSIMVAGGLLRTQDIPNGVPTGLSIFGGIMAFTGYVYANWIAPADLGSAGSDLQDFSARMK